MKDYILLIEDDGNDFIKINEIFKPYEDIFEIVPTQEEYDKVRYLLKSGGIYPYLQDILQTRHQEIKAIICDLKIESNQSRDVPQGSAIIDYIRNRIHIESDPLYTKEIPIIVLSHYANDNEAVLAIEKGADMNILKWNNVFLPQLIDAHIKRWNLRKTMEKYVDNVKIQIADNYNRPDAQYEEILKLLIEQRVILLNGFYISMNDSQRKKLYEQFKHELNDTLPKEELSKLNKSAWDQLSDVIVNYNRNGGFSALIENVTNILENFGILGNKGQCVMKCILGLLHLVESYPYDLE